MHKSMGEILRDLRKTNDLTQEQVAQALGVSFQTVSRWENGLSFPDVTLIPMLSRFFDVSTDFLFDMTPNLENFREQYETAYTEYRRDGKLSACRDCMQEALQQFPRNHHFMMNLAEVLYLFATGTAAQRREYAEWQYASRIRSLCEQVLDDSKKEQDRSRAVVLLCRHHAEAGNMTEALHLLSGVAKMEHCRDMLLGEILSGEEKLHQLQKNLLSTIDYAATALVNMAYRKEYGIAGTMTTEERISCIETANSLYALLMPDVNYQFFHRIVGWNHRRLAELYLIKCGDKERAFSHLLDAEKHASAYDHLSDHHYTALFVNTLCYEPDIYFKTWEGSECGMLLYRLSELESYFVGHDGFMALKERLTEETSGEPEIKIE